MQRIFSYGLRNRFGMAFDPVSGRLWQQQNGEDAFDELNLGARGSNSGWIQVMGPSTRVGQFREIETTSPNNEDTPNLQQLRWGPENIATTREEALSRLSCCRARTTANRSSHPLRHRHRHPDLTRRHLFLVSLADGKILEAFRRTPGTR